MSFTPLAALMAEGRPQTWPVARVEGEIISWGWMLHHSAGLAARLRQAQARRIGLWCADGHTLVVGLLAAARAGCAVVLPPGDQPGFLAGLSGAWDVAVGDAPGMMPVVDGGGADFTAKIQDIPVAFFTSGSTAQPKRVERRLGQLEAEVAGLHAVWPGAGWGMHHATVPHQHAYGLVYKVLWPLLCGRVFASVTHQFWETVLAELADGDILVSSPAHLGRLGGLEGLARPALVLSAGAPLPPAAADEAARLFGAQPVEIFGSTETGGIASRLAVPGQAWIPLPGNVVEAGAGGRLRLHSPWVGGSHEGADLVDVLADGRFLLHDRVDRVVKIEGKRIGLAAVEAALRALPQVEDAAVVKLTAGRDQLAAALVLSPQGRGLLAQFGPFRFGRWLRTALADQLEPLARPRLWRFVAELPCNSMGKRPDAAIAPLFSPPDMPAS
ncbi:AMP-binding protein [Magnetospirillum sulfuroxidans]|uniref:Acyl-CoA synthetase n=1 Tax=Magnetospirillum sulfuroxidans TaxID=611300 RepID=A0ABS5I6Z0_9PROT|nr:AMP-binding protein [Magnetospirillum sulfuroxidans]MBR9970179.1 acyl-CoA synthetase [Magnetospirillum sulfuroxidans]